MQICFEFRSETYIIHHLIEQKSQFIYFVVVLLRYIYLESLEQLICVNDKL